MNKLTVYREIVSKIDILRKQLSNANEKHLLREALDLIYLAANSAGIDLEDNYIPTIHR